MKILVRSDHLVEQLLLPMGKLEKEINTLLDTEAMVQQDVVLGKKVQRGKDQRSSQPDQSDNKKDVHDVTSIPIERTFNSSLAELPSKSGVQNKVVGGEGLTDSALIQKNQDSPSRENATQYPTEQILATQAIGSAQLESVVSQVDQAQRGQRLSQPDQSDNKKDVHDVTSIPIERTRNKVEKSGQQVRGGMAWNSPLAELPSKNGGWLKQGGRGGIRLRRRQTNFTSDQRQTFEEKTPLFMSDDDLQISRSVRTQDQKLTSILEPVLDQAYGSAAFTNDDASFVNIPQSGRVQNTFNVNVSMAQEIDSGSDSSQLEETLLKILRTAARRQGLEI